MTGWAQLPDDAFRTAFRDWLAANYPADWRKSPSRPFRRLRGPDMVMWLQRLQTEGWRAPAWPQAYGGMGLSFAQQRIYHGELERAQVARVIDFGEQMLGPVIMTCGTDRQKAELLPRILNCQDIWCQGYSEPNAGSDLASLTTRADLRGDDFVVTGQKTWTTHAQDSTHMFALVRTQDRPRRQEGISFLLIDLSAPGVTVRPMMNIAGEEEFCEVFLDDVVTPRTHLVGDLHDGWTVAKTLLGHERVWVGSPALCRNALDLAQATVAALGLQADLGVTDDLIRLAATLHDYEALYEEMSLNMATENKVSADVGMLKILATELQQQICEFTAEIAGELAGCVGPQQVGDVSVDVQWQLMMSRPITIFGGANAVQRDILAATLLQLPRSR